MSLPTKFPYGEPSHSGESAGHPAETSPELSADQLEHKFKTQWAQHERLEAMETVLGRPIYGEDLNANPLLAQVFLINNPDEAYLGLTMIKGMLVKTPESPDN